MQKGFLFDLNKCTGCNACQIACSIENDVQLPMNWRQVNIFNQSRHPEIPVFNLSMACNHCVDPPCLKYCPALAITKNELTGAVLINEELCIGCTYCSWVCPYDAPVFNSSQGIMDKCTFCNHRLEENLDPACVTLCPTTALQLSAKPEYIQEEKIPGFTQSEIKPAIQFVPLREDHQIPEISEVPFDESIVQHFRSSINQQKKKEKIRWIPELPLIVFSVLIAFISGFLAGNTLMKSTSGGYTPFIMGLIGFAMSTLHLGKKIRAPRAILNIKNSWLSREIALFSIFLFILSIQILLYPEIKWLAWLAIITGFLTLFSLDQIYSVVALETRLRYHSANALLTGLFFAALFSEFSFGIIIFGGIKLLLYLGQKFSQWPSGRFWLILLAILRLGFGFILPSIFWYMQLEEARTISIALIVIAEFIDRCDFYEGLKIITPEKQMAGDLERVLEKV
jgi:DMSO reductase iron-sulfur subunit